MVMVSERANVACYIQCCIVSHFQTFSSMKLIKTEFCNRLGESTLEYTMRIYVDDLNEILEEIIDHYKKEE